MLKTEEIITLEERWNELQNKRLFKKLVIFFLALLFILSIVLLYLVLTADAKKDSVVQNTSLPANNTVENIPTETKKAETSMGEQLPKTEPQNINININMPNSNTPSGETGESKNENITPPTLETINEQINTAVEPIAIPKENKIRIETNEVQDIDSLIKKFENTNNIVFATMISEEFFDKKDYEKSLEWALTANELDSKNELSWIMFAKNQVKLGRKDEAIHALEVFTGYSKDAATASALLKKIRSGEYR